MNRKRIVALLLVVLLLLGVMPIGAAQTPDELPFYQAIAQLLQSDWGDEFSVQEAANIDCELREQFQMMRVLVTLKPGATLPCVQPEAVVTGPNDLHVLQFASICAAVAAAAYLEASAYVLFAEPDVIVTPTNMQLQDLQPLNAAHLSWGVQRIGAPAYMAHLIAQGHQNANVVVAVLDTGVDAAHPWFANRLTTGFNAFNGSNNPHDNHGHGTHVAGTVVDVTLHMPNIRIMPVRVMNDFGEGTATTIIAGIHWAISNGAHVLNMSIGGPANAAMDNAVRYAAERNIVPVVAAGNDGRNAQSTSPARVAQAITVAATNNSDAPAWFSNFGDVVDVAAPGVSIRSALPNNRFGNDSGTSMAAPHVAGAVALLRAEHPGITPAAAREVIRESVTPWRFASDLRFGRGILNISEWIGGMLWLHQSDVFIDRSLNTQAQLSAFVFPTQPLVWSSSDTSVATVNQSGRVTGLTPGSATITVATQNGELADQLTVTVVNVGVTGVVLNQTSERDIIIGETFQLTATTIPANACSRNVVWRSSNSSITVDQNGLVTAGNNANRVADITARIYRGDGEYVQAETRFWTVYAPATRLTLDVTEHTMYFGQDVRVTAAVQPANADQFLHWRSNDPSVAEIISSGGVWPTWIVARGAGTAIITAQTRCGSHSSQVVITVPFVPVEGITLNRSEWTINENSTGVRLSPQLTPATAPNREVTWTTSDPSVATVRHYGFVDAVPGPGGVAIITATTQCGGHTAQATITVLPRVRVTGITIAGAATRALNVNQTLQLTATVTPANAANRNVQWQSTNPSVATVNGIGGVTARAPGTATIIATDAQTGDFSAQVIITVSRPVTGVSVSGAPAQLTRGQTAQLTANVTPVNATNRNVTWRSSDTSVATVSASGVVTAAGRGAATITATTVDGNRTAQTTIRVYNTIFSTRWEATFFNWLLFFLGFGFIWMWF